jgi:hypothetical protein
MRRGEGGTRVEFSALMSQVLVRELTRAGAVIGESPDTEVDISQ